MSCHETRGRRVGDLRAVRGHPTGRRATGGAPRWGRPVAQPAATGMRPRRAPRRPATRPGARAGADGRSARLAARLVRDGCSASARRRRLAVAGAAVPASRARTRDHDGGGGVAQAEQSRARHPPADTPVDSHSSNCMHFPARARAWLPWRWRGLARAAGRRSRRVPTRRQSDREGLFVSTLAHPGLGSHSCERATTGATAASSPGRTRSSARRHGAERASGGV